MKMSGHNVRIEWATMESAREIDNNNILGTVSKCAIDLNGFASLMKFVN